MNKSFIFFVFKNFLFLFIFIFCILISQDIKHEISQEINIFDLDKKPELQKIEKTVPFQDGIEERLKFKIVFQNIIAGYAELVARSPKNPGTNDLFYFEITAHTVSWVERIYTLNMIMLAYANPSDFSTVKYIEEKEEGNNYYYTAQYFSKKENSLLFSYRKNDKYVTKKFEKAIEGVSVPAAFYFARTVDLDKIGKIYYTMVAFRDKIYPVGVEVVAKEKISTAYGSREAIVVRPRMNFPGFLSEQKDMLIYLSTDKKRVPLLMVARTGWGDFKAYLIEGYTP